MRYLLDTHILLWFFEEPARLSEQDKSIILDPDSEIYVSIASAWEVAIKISLGKIDLQGGVNVFLQSIERNGFFLLPIKKEHLECVETLPFHHRDPFDRLLIATAIREGLGLVTDDEKIGLYELEQSL